MLSNLRSPSHCLMGQRDNLYTAFFIGLFVALFLIFFKPFGLELTDTSSLVSNGISFGLITFAFLSGFYFIVPNVFSNFFEEKNYTFGKDLLAHALMLLMLGITNGIYSKYAFSESTLNYVTIQEMILQTFLIGIFPLTFLTLLEHSRSNKSNVEASKQIANSGSLNKAEYAAKVNSNFHFSTDQEKVEVALKDFLFIEADGNYVRLYSHLNGSRTKTMYRATLKSIETDNTHDNIIRCHRSYIVNLDKVVDVQGNAQGLKLKLNDCQELVPVSRKYISQVKRYFN